MLKTKLGQELPEGVSMISYIYMGMAEPKWLSSGWYTEDTVEIYKRNDYNTEQSSEEAKELLKQRINYFMYNPKEALFYVGDKLWSTWLNPTFQTVWCSWPGVQLSWSPKYSQYLSNKKIVQSMMSGKLYKIEEQYFNGVQIIIFLAAAYGLWKIAKQKENSKIMLPMIFLGGFVFHLFWETKAIYVLQYYFLLVPYATYGLVKGKDNLLQKIQKIRREKRFKFASKLLQDGKECR